MLKNSQVEEYLQPESKGLMQPTQQLHLKSSLEELSQNDLDVEEQQEMD